MFFFSIEQIGGRAALIEPPHASRHARRPARRCRIPTAELS